jgi:hypothetical protein
MCRVCYVLLRLRTRVDALRDQCRGDAGGEAMGVVGAEPARRSCQFITPGGNSATSSRDPERDGGAEPV